MRCANALNLCSFAFSSLIAASISYVSSHGGSSSVRSANKSVRSSVDCAEVPFLIQLVLDTSFISKGVFIPGGNNLGEREVPSPTVRSGPFAYWATLPLRFGSRYGEISEKPSGGGVSSSLIPVEYGLKTSKFSIRFRNSGSSMLSHRCLKNAGFPLSSADRRLKNSSSVFQSFAVDPSSPNFSSSSPTLISISTGLTKRD